MPEKSAVLLALGEQVREELAVLERVTSMARDEATSTESRAENQYDTRATEASYLAAGQGERLLALRRLAGVEAMGADLFELDGPDGAAWFLLAPDGGGRRVRVGDTEVVVVTRASPVGEVLGGSRAGDVVALGRGEFEVVRRS
jgi:hypothetical protein